MEPRQPPSALAYSHCSGHESWQVIMTVFGIGVGIWVFTEVCSAWVPRPVRHIRPRQTLGGGQRPDTCIGIVKVKGA